MWFQLVKHGSFAFWLGQIYLPGLLINDFPFFMQEPWLVGLLSFHAVFLLVCIVSRKNINFQMFLFLFACKFTAIYSYPVSDISWFFMKWSVVLNWHQEMQSKYIINHVQTPNITTSSTRPGSLTRKQKYGF